MSSKDLVAIEIVCATPAKQMIVRSNVMHGTTARQAVDAAQLNSEFPDLDIAGLTLGVYGEVVADDYVVQSGDRVEIYRPLKRSLAKSDGFKQHALEGFSGKG